MMSLAELLPGVRSLSRVEKLRLIQLLVEELVRSEESVIAAGQSYLVWSPDQAHEAAAVLLQALGAEG
jgi:hypothetical protein